ncbi:linear amide C-N hydrolase [Tropicimonas aquimaris]|uniref:Linear amide C-N hydrolase n=1 Tax=Tropicimonas aquimaris TaxID=914152 RepID=A0ABW3IKU4_9RHOB
MTFRIAKHLLAATAIAAFGLTSTADACTGITLHAMDGASVYGRTMEWGAFDLHSRVMLLPRGHAFSSDLGEGMTGRTWTGRYGLVALDGLERPLALDGMNEAGLTLGAFYHPGFAEYAPIEPDRQAEALNPLDVGNFILSSFGSIAEVRERVGELHVVAAVEPVLGFPAPLHFLLTDPTGEALVIEFRGGQAVTFEAPLGVLTNAPTYDWHMTNLRNFVNLSPVALPGVSIGEIDFTPLGAGSGMKGLPGDFTPPSRFVRAVAFSATARPTEDGPETIYEVFRILDNFNLPLGGAEGSDVVGEIDAMRSATIWTTAMDTRNRVLYYHTQHNRRVRMLDLGKIDFETLAAPVFLPLDRERQQDIEELTLPN